MNFHTIFQLTHMLSWLNSYKAINLTMRIYSDIETIKRLY